MKKTKFYNQLSSADGTLTIDIHRMDETEIVKLAFKCAMDGNHIIMTNVCDIKRVVLERAAIAGKGVVLFDLR